MGRRSLIRVELRSKRIKRLPEWAQDAIQGSSDPLGDAEAVQIAQRIISDYGGARRLKRLLHLFENGELIETIGVEFRVTKQRVSQWRHALGFVEESFVARDLVKQILKKNLP